MNNFIERLKDYIEKRTDVLDSNGASILNSDALLDWIDVNAPAPPADVYGYTQAKKIEILERIVPDGKTEIIYWGAEIVVDDFSDSEGATGCDTGHEDIFQD